MTVKILPSPPDFVNVAKKGETPCRLAVRAFPGTAPTLVWLGGYRSDMLGTKAERLSAFAQSRGLGLCRFDYSGHGESDGRFEDGTISRWRDDALAVIEAKTEGPLILVGSSMGAWIALLLARRGGNATPLGARIAGLLLLAPAPDFTQKLLLPAMTPQQRQDLETKGFCTEPSDYSAEPNIYTRALIEDGAANSVLDGPIATDCPIRIVQGMADPDVPFAHALELVSHLPTDAVTVTLAPGGDHRLSREADLLLIEQAASDLVKACRTSSSTLVP